ncbi:hypothetical protein FSP39_010180 [Pinctada imbricata]|uniref:Histone-lysine N-methyltransferase NSD2 n=1 Tax=Pinctada imbricata TaxID=66713 RepID=A0AA88Y8U2_PINIB|nr:hypothetical protein FSP39_010180 [Pinctada imbricata]
MSGSGQAGGFRHHLPQIANLTRSTKIAQSKTSSKSEKSADAATIHVEGTGVVVTMDADLNQEIIVQENTEKKDEGSMDGEKTKTPKSQAKGKGKSGSARGKGKKANSKEDVGKSEMSSEPSVVGNDVENAQVDVDSPRVKQRDEVSGLKSIFAFSPVEGKRQRKPKIIDDDSLSTSPRSASKAEAQKTPKGPTTSPPVVEKPTEWEEGDVLWAKVTGHPWWPCLVAGDFIGTLEPDVYTKMKGRVRNYHVHFFGNEGERGWVTNTMEFKGKEKYDEHVKKLFENAKDRKMEKLRLEKLFKVFPRRQAAWKIAIEQAEEFLPLSKEERKSKFMEAYPMEPIVQIESAEPISVEHSGKVDEYIKAVIMSPPKSRSPRSPKRKRKRTEHSPATKQPRSKKARVEKTATNSPAASDLSFEVFVQKHKDIVQEENPDIDEPTLMETLFQQWRTMSQKQKARYKSKFTQDQDEMQTLRVRKPSLKVKEAEENMRALDDILCQEEEPSEIRSSRASGRLRVTEQQDSLETGTEISQNNSVKKNGRAKQTQEKQNNVLHSDADSENQSGEKPMEVETDPIEENIGNDKGVNTELDYQSGSCKSKKKKKLLLDETINAVASGENEILTTINSLDETISAVAAGEGTITNKSSKANDMEVHEEEKVIEEVQQKLPKPALSDEYENEIFKLSGSGPTKKENLCLICEDVGELIECTGPCLGFFHLSCLGLVQDPAPGQFKCSECKTGIHTCFSCKKADSTTKKCAVVQCGKFYHEDCVNKLINTRKENSKGFFCPLHICQSCAYENPKGAKACRGRLLRCVRCPTAYHIGDFCIAAGSENLPGYNIVCSKHFQPLKTKNYHSHVNVGWCFVCNLGGSLLCCESCPAAFHTDCLQIEQPEGSWFCNDCASGKEPLYGEIIWIKLGNFRWWPAEICHQKNVPLNIQDKPHQVGEFPVRFFGTHDFFWIHKGRIFSFQDGDRGSKERGSSKYLAKLFTRGVEEACVSYKLWKDFKANKEQVMIEKSEKKPAPFKFVKTNIPVGSVQIYKADLTEIPRCECKPEDVTPCSSDTDCLNRMLMYECHPQVCPVGDKCNNQRFQKRLYPDSEPFKTEGRGWGLRTLVDIKKGQFVNEYVGELIDEAEVKKRINIAHEDNILNFYMLTLDKNRIIDAGPKGNLSRFMNHSCDPNCETQKWTVNGDVRVGLFSLHDIPAGSELTFNYNLECLGNDKTKCNCGAEVCSGFLGVRPKTAYALTVDKKKKLEKKKRRRKKKNLLVKKEHEDDCFRCGEGGELVMCDRTGCPKVYHLHCLKLSKPPHGKWDCPWHHCDECGRQATTMCVECPNSFCQDHAGGNLTEVEGQFYCSDHEDVLEAPSSNASSIASSDIDTEDADNDENGRTVKTKALLKENLDKKKTNGKSEEVAAKVGSRMSRKSSDSVKGGVKLGEKKTLTNSFLKSETPMFDDSDDDKFSDLVIDIPAIPI